MGKIRVSTLGDETAEAEQKKKAEQRKEQKKAEKPADASPVAEGATEVKEENKGKKVSTYAKKNQKAPRSKKYQEVVKQVDKNRVYPLSEAVELLSGVRIASFDETVELHINTHESGLSGNLSLPHGTGKRTRVAVASDKIIAEVEKGKISFDVLLAEPAMMPKLARVAKYLGPRGLMPNPKNGTVTTNPQELIKKYEAGQVSYKTEAKTPLLHLTVGKISFGKEKLLENITVALATVQTANMKKVVLKSTMSPGIKIDFSNV